MARRGQFTWRLTRTLTVIGGQTFQGDCLVHRSPRWRSGWQRPAFLARPKTPCRDTSAQSRAIDARISYVQATVLIERRRKLRLRSCNRT